ncbi:N-acetylmuramoyl-L-alanine amidase [Candidatus Koribacter versatilis Ellin345]|uniref:N-acetylmuramoyl-L-alanine amidase n=1 Tax=Koribacter versatilis (strain Ellin345) TaxID=204669 RepID=Q1ISJ4_KORVE|nr:N-acetylmuramoyl-L-alanine amidase [Candidatus Koribacter versatilis]ABF40156.1 N-acetylmuramoyl-L-alanine amidase [Candidatus Koribacter versatilis Ellin345]
MGFRVRTFRGRQWAALLLLLTTATFVAFSAPSTSRKKELALSAYEDAEKMREALNGQPEKDRTKAAYQKVIEAYKKVYFTTPASSKADASILAVAEVMAEEGRHFQDQKPLKDAIAQYEFLRKEYPGSKYRMDALFTIGQIQKEDLKDPAAAKATFEEFLQRYPKSQLVDQAHKALADLSAPPPLTPTEVQAAAVAEKKHAAMPTVNGIRYWSTPDYTRVAIDLDDEVKYEAGRIPHPDRIFFDLHNAKLASTLVGKSFEVGDGFLRTVRVAPYQKDVVRIVLDVEDVADYSAFLLPNPYRLIIDIHGKKPATAVATNKPEKKAEEPRAEKKTELAEAKPAPKPETPKETPKPAKKETAKAEPPSNETKRPEVAQKADSTPPTSPQADAAGVKKSQEQMRTEAADYERKYKAAKEEGNPLPKPDADLAATKSGVKATTAPTSKPTYQAVEPKAPKTETASTSKGKKSKASEVAEIHEAAPTAAGDRSLIRALGLKINRIVVDAGHGGHDTGTVGPSGYSEKELVLDVALRLGKLLESRLGSEVIYTRDDDTFIPLETRTAIANQHEADLFVSVHANSSRDKSARGVETYYLNFTSDPAALDVAARENAVSEKSIHELQDLVKKITLKEKIDESRELASDIEGSLATGLSNKSAPMRNRGVKKAPFIVLIGANMPSILAEISFLSNPADEKKLKTPEYRQKIAESLYKGVSKYVSSLSSVKVAQQTQKAPGD